MSVVTLLELTKANDMHFVYSAFAEDGSIVYVKVGQSVKPFSRIKALLTGCPFEIKRAVFCHAGSKRVAEGIEASVKHQLGAFRTRGEWYKFQKDQGSAFSEGMKFCFKRITGRDLIWSPIDMSEVRRLGYEATCEKFGTRKRKPWEVMR